MKKLILTSSLLLASLIGMSQDAPAEKSKPSNKGKFKGVMKRKNPQARGIEIYTHMVDSCKYVVFIYSEYGAGGTHAGDCPNPIHMNRKENAATKQAFRFKD